MPKATPRVNQMGHVYQLPASNHAEPFDAREKFLAGEVLGDTLGGRHVTAFFEENPDLEPMAREDPAVWVDGVRWHLISKEDDSARA